MSFKQTVTRAILGADGKTVSGSVESEGEQGIELDFAIPINADHVEELALKAAGLLSLGIMATCACTVTFKNGVPASVGSVVLAANVPYVWTSVDDVTQNPIPISGDVVTLHSNSAATGTMKVRVIQNS